MPLTSYVRLDRLRSGEGPERESSRKIHVDCSRDGAGGARRKSPVTYRVRTATKVGMRLNIKKTCFASVARAGGLASANPELVIRFTYATPDRCRACGVRPGCPDLRPTHAR